ncbi:MAG: hypothetical protein FDX21_05800 [Chlorobium sp.]|nr:MAG: hypothetical protein FDX21_05800 [Chlorobium sp.]
MTKDDLIKRILGSKIFTEWHWFKYHFDFYNIGLEHPFSWSIVDACLKVEERIPGFAYKFMDDLASFSGIEKHLPHYEQILQKLAELYVINKSIEFEWEEGTIFYLEPTIGESNKNPEINIETPRFIIGIEVKAPSLIDHINKRTANPFQLSVRSNQILDVAKNIHGDSITFPRDNPVKDFLKSANQKFASFKTLSDKPYFSSLFIVWDDYIYEPVTALTAPYSGLLTENSFYKDNDGHAVKFPNVDIVILLRHLQNIISATRYEPLIEVSHALDYTHRNVFPPKVFIPVNNEDKIPIDFINAFELLPLNSMIGAEYHPSDGIWWI